MQIAILGPLEVRDDAGCTVDVAGARVRTLLARLALDVGRPVRVDELVDAVWGERPPAEATNALQTLVSRLRRAFGGAAMISQSPSGYRLDLAADAVDAVRFRTLAAQGSDELRRGNAARALPLLDDALGLWRGRALADCRDQAGSLATAAAGLDELQHATVIDRLDARIAVDGAADPTELEQLVTEHPLDERLAALHLRALAAAGRQADALRAYDAVRVRLVDELGVDPSPELKQLHLDLLRGSETPRPRRTNLKAQLTSFVGREGDVARIAKTLEQNRLVTLVGPGGAGKTRLAAEAGTSILDTVPDGIWMAELATVTSGADLPQAVLGSLGLREMHLMSETRTKITARDATERLCDALADRAAVLVLDNCEHVIESAAGLAELLLTECPDLRVLATSREPLAILGEAVLAVRPLGQPAPDASPSDASAYPAVQLFADRAGAAQPGWTIDDTTVASVIEIVRRLDGLPLAIELAAARLRTLPVDAIAARLSDRFRLLTGGSRTALPRHRTLRAVVEWSWGLLDVGERELAEALSVFPAGVTVASATAVRPASLAADEVEDVLTALLDKSLLQPVDGGRRMRMLETIREFGIEQLGDRGELGTARQRHARHFADLLFDAEPYLTTRDQLPYFEALTAERENIVAAMRWFCDAEDADTAVQLAVSLAVYGMMLGEHSDIAAWTEAALDVPGGTDDTTRLVARAILTLNATASGDQDSASSSMDGMRDVVRELAAHETPIDSPMLMLMRPIMAFFAGDEDLAQRWSDEALDSANPWIRASTRMFRAGFAENSGALDIARADTDLALAEFTELGERWGLASVLRNVAQLRTLDGDLPGAVAAYEQALELTRELNSTDDEVYVHARLAELALRQGDTRAAARYMVVPRSRIGDERTPFDGLFALAVVGDMEYRLGDEATGRAHIDEAMARLEVMPREYPAMGHVRAMVNAIAARIALTGESGRAATYAARSVEAAIATKDLPILAMAGVAATAVVRAQGAPAEAAELLGATAALRGSEDPTNLEIVELVDQLRDELGADAFEARYAEGRALPQEAALARFEDLQARLR